MIFYESPHRVAATLTDFARVFGGERRAVVCRELTKLHEETLRGTLNELAGWARATQVRGEIVIVVAGAEPAETPQAQDIVGLVLERVDAGERLKTRAPPSPLKRVPPNKSSTQLPLLPETSTPKTHFNTARRRIPCARAAPSKPNSPRNI